MNERIRELIAEADRKCSETRGIYDEILAELIIRECMHECLRMQLGNQYTPEELLFQTKYRKIIKEHFGVKE